MTEHLNRGQYSLIQYRPDASRLESVNIGVLLASPHTQFLEIKLAKNFSRVKQLFGSSHAQKAEQVGDALANRIKLERERLGYEEQLVDFVARRGNGLWLTPLRPLKFDDASEELVRLYDRLVEYDERQKGQEDEVRP